MNFDEALETFWKHSRLGNEDERSSAVSAKRAAARGLKELLLLMWQNPVPVVDIEGLSEEESALLCRIFANDRGYRLLNGEAVTADRLIASGLVCFRNERHRLTNEGIEAIYAAQERQMYGVKARR